MSALSTLTPEQLAVARDELFRRGDLTLLLDSNQLEARARFYGNTASVFVIEASRQLGKSFLCAVLAFEQCIRQPRSRVPYASPTAKESKEIALPTMGTIAAQLPADVRPEWKAAEGRWTFPNGSEIVLFGADSTQDADRGRGPNAHFAIVDEAGFTPVLSYLVNSVLLPMMMLTNGRILLSSTPPPSPGHDFSGFADQAFERGAYVNKTIYDHARMTRVQVDQFLTQLAESQGLTLEQFKLTATCRREYLAERVIDDTLAIVPEFSRYKDQIVREHPRAPFFDLYISLDPGLSDKTGVLFAVSDFRAGILSIEHELLLNGANTLQIADAIKGVLATYPKTIDGYGKEQGIVPYAAVVDATVPFVDRDLYNFHKLQFSVADKRDSEAAINAMRLELPNIRIHPRCVNLIRQLQNAVRAKPGGDMIRTARDGHFDLVAAMKYLVRIWSKSHVPVRRTPYRGCDRGEVDRPLWRDRRGWCGNNGWRSGGRAAPAVRSSLPAWV